MPVLQRAPVPVLQNTTIPTRAQALEYPSAALNFVQCSQCSFVWNADFSDDTINYDQSYNNDVSSSNYYRDHLAERALEIIRSVPQDQPIHLLEIGCGEGEFLNLIAEIGQGRVASATAFDPSYSGKNPLVDGAIVHRAYFSEQNRHLINPATNVIVSRHTIEHISNPNGFIEALTQAATRDDVSIFIETPTVDWIFDNLAFYDFFYEHCSLFNPASISILFQQFAFGGTVDLVYGGQYLWGHFKRAIAPSSHTEQALESIKKAAGFRADFARIADIYRDRLFDKGDSHRIGIWGAASKGVTFALAMRHMGADIDFAIDLNKAKQGCFLPLTGLEIESPQAVGLTDADQIIVMNPNYIGEIKQLLQQMGVRATVEPILGAR